MIEEDRITELWYQASGATQETPADMPYAFAELIEKEICQLFEPKPDEGRLLTDEKINSLIFKAGELLQELSDKPEAYNQEEFVTFGKSTLKNLLEDQRDLTASIKDAECQERVERIFREIEKESYVEKHHPWGKDVYIDVRFMEEGKWQALKKKEGVK